nr:ribonuclease H [Tanacetum cinerariifolium]
MDYGFSFNKIPIYCDSKSGIAISCNPVQHLRTKHIAVRYHFIKEHMEKGSIELYFVKTDYQLADLFTKALPADRFSYLVYRLGMRSLSPQELNRLAKSHLELVLYRKENVHLCPFILKQQEVHIFLAEAIATTWFTQNHSIIHRRFNKTPYELINGRKPDISFLHVFGALCYPKNDREDIGKLGAKGDIGFFIGYSADSCTYRIYNRRTKKIIKTMNDVDELNSQQQHVQQQGNQAHLQSTTVADNVPNAMFDGNTQSQRDLPKNTPSDREEVLGDAYKNDNLKTMKPYQITASSFKPSTASMVPLTSHMGKHVAQPKALIEKNSRKKKIPSSSEPKTSNIVRESLSMKQDAGTQPAEETVATANTTLSLDAPESTEEQGNQLKHANSTKDTTKIPQNDHVIEEADSNLDSTLGDEIESISAFEADETDDDHHQSEHKEELSKTDEATDKIADSVPRMVADAFEERMLKLLFDTFKNILPQIIKDPIKQSVKKALPKFDKRVEKTLKAQVPEIILKLLNKEFNALNKMESISPTFKVNPPYSMKGISCFIGTSSAAMIFSLSATIKGGVRENSEELELQILAENYSKGMLLMMTGGLMPCGIIKFKGSREGMVKFCTTNFNFLARGSSTED